MACLAPAPLAVVAAIFADIYNNETRGLAISCFSATVFMGPLLAPFIGGFIAESYSWMEMDHVVSSWEQNLFNLGHFHKLYHGRCLEIYVLQILPQ